MLSTRVVTLLVTSLILSLPNFTIQKRDRVVKKIYEGVEAVEVTSVEVNGVAVEAGKKFPAGNDWLNGLKIKLTNISGKPIAHVIVELSFDYPGMEGFVYSVPSGIMPQSREAAESSKKVQPDESI